ncbi:MAG: type III pantothenate kinase [Candidatus Bipolaricaulia bacterium]
MILVGDVGNTQTVLGLFAEKVLVEHWRLTTDRNRTCDELAILMRGLLQDTEHTPDEIDAIAIASVVPSLHRSLKGGLEKVFGVEPRFLTPANCGIRLDVKEPQAVGADRIANTIAAQALFGGPCLVIDFGTATNFDLVGEGGAFLGGAIAPEMQLAAQALTDQAAQLHSIPLDVPESVTGKTTTENLQAGIVLGYLDLVAGLIGRFRDEHPGIERVIATGGKGELFARELEAIDEHVPFLTLRGLKLWLQGSTD